MRLGDMEGIKILLSNEMSKLNLVQRLNDKQNTVLHQMLEICKRSPTKMDYYKQVTFVKVAIVSLLHSIRSVTYGHPIAMGNLLVSSTRSFPTESNLLYLFVSPTDNSCNW